MVKQEVSCKSVLSTRADVAEEIRRGTACGLTVAQDKNGEDEDGRSWATGRRRLKRRRVDGGWLSVSLRFEFC